MTSARELMQVVLKRTLDYDFTTWHWGDAVAVDGLLEAAELLGTDEPVDRLVGFYRQWAARPRAWLDHLTPGAGLLRLQALTQDQAFQTAALDLARLLRAAPRSRHYDAPMYRPDLDRYRHAIWVDTIYHEPSFLCRLGRLTGDNAFHSQGAEVWFSHVRALSSPQGPFLGHSRDGCSRALKGYGWGRGQGWAFYGMIDIMEFLPTSHPDYGRALQHVRDYASNLRAQQDRSGFWRTLIHDREAYLESSTAAFLGGAFLRGVRLKILDESYREPAERAWQAAASRVDADGNFFGVSAWTHAGVAMEDIVSMYKTLPTEMNCWGQGCMLRFCAERLRSNLG